MLSTMLQAGRAFLIRPNGNLQLRVDKNRASVFTVSRSNMLSFTATDQPLSSAANRIVGKFRDKLLPAINGTIQSISFPDHGVPTVTMDAPHPLAVNDRIYIGGTDTRYDTTWIVGTVPTADANDDVFTLSALQLRYARRYTSCVSDGFRCF